MPGQVLGTDPRLKGEVHGKRFGVRWNKTQSPTTLTRLYDSIGKTFIPSVGTAAGSSGFDEEPIYKDIRRCVMVNGAVAYYEGEPGFTTTPASGDVMVEIPRFYFKVEDTTTHRDYIISDQPLEGYEISPRHAPHAGKPAGYDKIYVSAYTLNDAYRSLSGNASIVSITRAQARAGCKGRGSLYHLWDYATYATINLLYLVEVADWDSQTAVGPGYTDSTNNAQINTGGANFVAGHSGRANGDANAAKNAIKYRHMENLWGNLRQWCDGMNFNENTTYLSLNPATYADDTTAGYSELAYQKASASGYQKALGLDPAFPFAQICTDSGGEDGTFIPDYYYRSEGWRVLAVGGLWTYAGNAGLFCFIASSAAASTGTYVGCRLLVLP